jgi:hypothetical protein
MDAPQEFYPRAVASQIPKILAVTVGGVLLLCALLLGTIAAGDSQVAYLFRGGALTIQTGSFLDGNRHFLTTAVTDARLVNLTASRRVRGTAMDSVCTGRFWHPETDVVWQATDCSKTGVLLTVAGEDFPILVSPPNPQEFVRLLAMPAEGRIVLTPGRVGPLRLLIGATAVAVAIGALLLAAVFLRGANRMRYFVGNGELVVRTLFRHRAWPLGQLKARAYSPTAPARLVGASMPGCYTGLFLEQGKSLRIYATDLANGVLLEKGAERVYLSPGDPEMFLAALATEQQELNQLIAG